MRSLNVGIAITPQVGSKIIHGDKEDIGPGWFCLISATGTSRGDPNDHQDEPGYFLK